MASSPQNGSITNFSQQSQENDAQDPHDLGDFETFCDFTTSSGTSSATNDVHDDADLLLSDGINFADELRRRCVNDVHRFQTLLAMIRALQRRGKETELRARLNTPDSHNNLLLHQALSSSRIDEFILLLTNGADPNQKSIDNKTAWSIVNSRATDYRIELSPFLIIQIMHFVNFCAMNKDSRLSIDIGLTYKIGKDRKEIEFKTKTLTYVELLGYLSRWEPLSDPSAQPSYRIHVPSTNGALLMMIFSLLDRDPYVHARRWDLDSQRPVSYFLRSFKWSLVVCENKYLAHRDPSYLPESVERGRGFASIAFPCLVLDEVRLWTNRKKKYMDLIDDMDMRRSDKQFCEERMVHFEQTLDEAYYPGLTVTDHTLRNEDQVVTKEFERAKPGSSDINPENSRTEDIRPILLVPQLWIWKAEKNVVSAYSLPRQTYGYIIGEQSLLKPQNENGDADLFIGSMLKAHIEGFGQHYERGSVIYPPALDMFEQHVVSVVTEVSKYVNESPPSKMNFHTERKLLHRLSDVQEELAMVKYVLEQQEEAFKEFLENAGIETDKSKDGSIRKKPGSIKIKPDIDTKTTKTDVDRAKERWAMIRSATTTLARYKRRIEKIKNDSERIEKEVKDKLELKRTYASVKATRNGLILSLAAVAFAVVTVFFAPLAFLPALFALKMEGFPQLYVNPMSKGDDIVYRSDKMGGIFASSEVLTIAITLVFVLLAKQWLDRQDKIDKEECENDGRKPKATPATAASSTPNITSPSSVSPGPTTSSTSIAVSRPTGASSGKAISTQMANSTSAAIMNPNLPENSTPPSNSAQPTKNTRQEDIQFEQSKSRRKASDDVEAQHGAIAST